MYYFKDTIGNPDVLYKHILKNIMLAGTETKPRGFNCKELSPCAVELELPQYNIINSPIRKINKAFAAAEFFWMLTGKSDVEFIEFYNPKIKQFSDDGVSFFGAYGPRIASQLSQVVETLTADPWSRQGVLTIWQQNPPLTKDVPCTVMMQFMRRPLDKLNLTVFMRSQDIWLGFPYDLHNFTCLQIVVAQMMGLQLGKFTLIQNSLHAYEQDFEKIEKVSKEHMFENPEFTPPPDSGLALPHWKHIVDSVDTWARTPSCDLDQIKKVIVSYNDEFLNQKLTWMLNYASKKRLAF